MTNTKRILDYASDKRRSFRRKDLLQYLVSQDSGTNEKSIDIQLNRLLLSGKLQRAGHGEYMLAENWLPEYLYKPSQSEQHLYIELKKQFPLLDFCVWRPKILSSFMLHIPNIGYSFIDVEKDGMEPVFHTLQSMNLGKNILLSPSEIECERYLTGTDAIVVRQLIGRSPLAEVDGCMVPMIEKILTDTVGDNELKFADGSEVFNIFENALERYNINRPKMLSYASRRNRKGKIGHILKTLDCICTAYHRNPILQGRKNVCYGNYKTTF